MPSNPVEEYANREDADDDDDDEEANEAGTAFETSYIEEAFHNRRPFTCPLVKQLLATGNSGADLSPDDIDIVAAMGDALSVSSFTTI